MLVYSRSAQEIYRNHKFLYKCLQLTFLTSCETERKHITIKVLIYLTGILLLMTAFCSNQDHQLFISKSDPKVICRFFIYRNSCKQSIYHDDMLYNNLDSNLD